MKIIQIINYYVNIGECHDYIEVQDLFSPSKFYSNSMIFSLSEKFYLPLIFSDSKKKKNNFFMLLHKIRRFYWLQFLNRFWYICRFYFFSLNQISSLILVFKHYQIFRKNHISLLILFFFTESHQFSDSIFIFF